MSSIDKEYLEIMARLQTLAAISKAKIDADPKTHIKIISKRLIEMIELVERVEYALSPDLIFDIAQEAETKPANINAEALIRCNHALEEIHRFKRRNSSVRDGTDHA